MIELLETRVLMSASGHTATTTFHVEGRATKSELSTAARSQLSATPTAAAALTAPFTPAEIDEAYGISNISFNGVAGTGSQQTIAIIDAYNDPDIVADAATFSTEFNLPQFNTAGDPTLTVLNETGGTTLPANASAGTWDLEESLDVQWAHSVAPDANIAVFEANSAQTTDLFAAVKTAADYSGVSAVSMSFGTSEYSSERNSDSTFLTPAGHQGVTFLASTGDNGEPGLYPAYSPNVLAVGGTGLTINGDGSYGGETGWSDGGGGISSYESQPTYQSGKVNGLSSTRRTIPDVSMDANPSTGVYVLDSYYGGANAYYEVGGTSLAAPLWAGVIAVANQGRVLNGLGTLNSASQTQTLPALYTQSSSEFHDVTSGNNGFAASAGYDLVTGIGSPLANLLAPSLAGDASDQLVFAQQPTATNIGNAISPPVTVDIDNASGALVTTGASYVTLSIASGPAGAGLQGTVTVQAVNGVATFSNLTPSAIGTYTLSAVDGSLTATSSAFTVALAPTSLSLVDNGSSSSNATQSVSFTATISGGVPDGETVYLESPGSGNTAVTVIASAVLSGGAATFTFAPGTLLAGAHSFFAAYNGDATYAPSTSATLTQTVQVVVTGVVVNGNITALAGAQRSMVQSIVYSFSEPVNLAAAGAFTIAVHTGQAGTAPTLAWSALNPASDGSSTQWVVTFSGSGVAGGSIGNGVYDITFNASAATSDANPAVASQPRSTDTFWRLYGDYAGTGYVNNGDYLTFLSTYGLKSTQPGYLASVDATGSSARIGNADYLDFLSDYGIRYRNVTMIATI